MSKQHFGEFNFRSKDAAARLEALLAEVKPQDLCYELSHHPHKGDAIGLLSVLGQRLDRACELLVLAFPDSQRSVVALVDCLGRQTEWSEFDRLLELQRGFRGQRSTWLREFRLLVESGLNQPGAEVTLPLRQRLPAAVTSSGLAAAVRGWFAPKAREPQRSAGLSSEVFRGRYLSSQEPAVPPAGHAPVRTRQQRIDDALMGGELTPEMFRMLTSRDDGFANLRKLIQTRPQALEDLGHVEFGQDLTLEQFEELWPMLTGSTLEQFGPKLMSNVRELLSRDRLLRLCESASAAVVRWAVGDLSLRFAGGVREDGELARQIFRAHPSLARDLRKHFISVIPPAAHELPRFSRSLEGDGPVSLVVTEEQIVVSAPGLLEWFCARSGHSLFRHCAPDLPRLLYALGPGCYLGQRGALLCCVEASPSRLTLRDSLSPLELGERLLVGYSRGMVHLQVYDEFDHCQKFVFDLTNGEIRTDKHHPSAQSDGETLDSLWLARSRTVYPNGADLQIFVESYKQLFLAYPRRSVPGTLQVAFHKRLACGLECYPEGYTWHCWRLDDLAAG